MLDESANGGHVLPVSISDDFLDRLKAAGVTQKRIADVLGVAQPNANTLYNLAKNGKRRQLKLEEAVALSKATGVPLIEGDVVAKPEWPSADQIAPIVGALLPSVPKSEAAGSGAEVLSEALLYGLELLGEPGAIRTSEDAIAVAARGAASRFRDLLRQ